MAVNSAPAFDPEAIARLEAEKVARNPAKALKALAKRKSGKAKGKLTGEGAGSPSGAAGGKKGKMPEYVFGLKMDGGLTMAETLTNVQDSLGSEEPRYVFGRRNPRAGARGRNSATRALMQLAKRRKNTRIENVQDTIALQGTTGKNLRFFHGDKSNKDYKKKHPDSPSQPSNQKENTKVDSDTRVSASSGAAEADTLTADHTPQNRARYESEVRPDYLDKIKKSGLTEEEVITRLKKVVDPDEIDIAIQTPLSVLKNILEEGYKTQSETGTSMALFDPQTRQMVETSMFGEGKAGSIYGFARSKHTPETNETDGYGEVSVVLKNSVRPRTTFTIGDSLRHPASTPSGVNDPHIGSMNGYSGTLKKASNIGEVNKAIGYVELQIHGKVTKSDIDRMVFLKEPDAETKSLLKKHGIPFDIDSRMAPSRFMAERLLFHGTASRPGYAKLHPDSLRITSKQAENAGIDLSSRVRSPRSIATDTRPVGQKKESLPAGITNEIIRDEHIKKGTRIGRVNPDTGQAEFATIMSTKTDSSYFVQMKDKDGNYKALYGPDKDVYFVRDGAKSLNPRETDYFTVPNVKNITEALAKHGADHAIDFSGKKLDLMSEEVRIKNSRGWRLADAIKAPSANLPADLGPKKIVGEKAGGEDKKYADINREVDGAAVARHQRKNDPEAYEAFREYKNGDFADINNHLRTGNGDERTRKQIDAIDRGMTAELKSDTRLYRGLEGLEHLGAKNPKDLIGKEFVDKGYVSTTSNAAVAKRFATRFDPDDDPDKGKGVVMVIKAKAGTKVAPMDHHQVDTDGDGREYEILLPRGKRYRVIGYAARSRTGPPELHVEML